MLKKVGSWFKKLSLWGKIGVIAGVIFLSLVAIGIAAPTKIEEKTETRTEEIAFETTYIKDSTLEKDKIVIKTPGEKGKKEVIYKVTYTNGRETKKVSISEKILIKAKKQISRKGTRETLTETKEVPIAFPESTIYDSTMEKGTTEIRTDGSDGTKKQTYEVIKIEGKEVSRKLVKEEVIKQPVTRVTAIGTKTVSPCDPNYSGACVPIASDVDCAGGSGNGPAYVSGPVYVIGFDIYDLDRDGDGVACE